MSVSLPCSQLFEFVHIYHLPLKLCEINMNQPLKLRAK